MMTVAGYNAGRGRVREWVKQFGDPRDPNVDAVDWVERIPFAETRNYVQRVMENLQVYRVRFDSGASVMSKSDQRDGLAHEASSPLLSSAETPAPPLTLVEKPPQTAPRSVPELMTDEAVAEMEPVVHW